MKKLLSLVVLSLTFVAHSEAQSSIKQSSVKVGSTTYTVTIYPHTLRTAGMVMLSGPEGNAMVQVEGDKITAYISPPGGGSQKALIDKVWSAYLGDKGGAAATRDSGAGLTVDGVISMLSAGISSDVIVTKIQKSGQSFDLSTDDIVRLKKAGASDEVMKSMMTSSAPAPVVVPVDTMPRGRGADKPPVNVPPNPVAENPDMGKLKKEGFMATVMHSVGNAAQGKSVIDQLSMRNILPPWDPNQNVNAQYPHIAITVLSAPMGWMDNYREVLRKSNNNKLNQPCFRLKALVWLDATRSKATDEFQWCLQKDMFMSELQPTYLYSLAETKAEFGQTTGISRTDGPQPPDKLLPNDRETLDMEAKTDPQGARKDLNLDSTSLFAIMFANVRKDLGETLSSDGDFRVWITSLKKAAGPSLF
jgi:hypothetical protein